MDTELLSVSLLGANRQNATNWSITLSLTITTVTGRQVQHIGRVTYYNTWSLTLSWSGAGTVKVVMMEEIRPLRRRIQPPPPVENGMRRCRRKFFGGPRRL